MNKNQKSLGYEAVQKKIMCFFENHNSLITKFGYQEKLIAILKAYQSQQSTADKRKNILNSPLRVDRKLVESGKENTSPNIIHQIPISNYSRKLMVDDKGSSGSKHKVKHVDMSDSMTDYDFQLH